MTAVPAGASSHQPLDWHQINWQAAQQNVRRLQARIVKAVQAGRWGKVQALQRLLTRSFSGKVLAVRRVTENQGKRTAGVDGVTWNTPAKKAKAIHTLRQRGYRPKPLRRVYIPKKNGKQRPLGIPTMHDRAMQALYLLALDPVAETTADPNSYGFRPERSPADAIGQCFITLAREAAPQWILEGDITSCFDRINHDWMLNHIPTERTVLQKWLKAGYIEQHVRYPTDEGTPQGGVISPTLANMTLDGLEHLLRTHFPRTKDGRSPMVNLVRYADDFIITGRSRELLEHEVQPLVEAFLRARGLELSPEKTHVTHIKDGFDFLGQHIRKYQAGRRHKLLITPARKRVKTFLDAVRSTIRSNKQTSAAILIGLLNPRIVGWANYHRHVVSKETYSSVDNAIYQALWRWAKRRHPQKSRTWIVQHYFKRHGGDNWRFYSETTGKTLLLRNAAQLPITRHVKIKDGANPYDPAWEIYFEQRLGVKMGATLRGRRHLMHLWKEQGGCCPVCQEPITELTGWHNHHIIWRTHGGTDHAENRVLLHPTCHRKVHALGLYVEKPRPSSGV